MKCANQKTNNLNLSENMDVAVSGHCIDASAFTYTSYGLLCSNKLPAIQNFIFDAVISAGHLVRALVNEPSLGKYLLYLRCANKYAVDNGIWDNSSYPINTHLDEDEIEKCEILKMIAKDLLKKKIVTELYECHKNYDDRIFSIALKYFILTQVELSEEAKINEKTTLNAIEKEMFEDTVKCILQYTKSKTDEDKDLDLKILVVIYYSMKRIFNFKFD